jgi:hypothetical protein
MAAQARFDDPTGVRPRCNGCGKGLGFDEWSSGIDSCAACRRDRFQATPAATFVRGPATPRRGQPGVVTRKRRAHNLTAHEELLDDIPQELVDELVAMLEAEAARRPAAGDGAAAALHGVLEDVGFGKSPLEFQWAAWGFATGFSANVAMAKYAQMSTGSAMGQFLMPMLFGGLVAGTACAVIGWGLAKLRER